VEQLGGPKIPGIGFAMGMERLVLLLQQAGSAPGPAVTDLFIAALGEEAGRKAFQLTHQLRMRGKKVAIDLDGRSLKSQMKQAAKCQARYTLILGEDELAKSEAQLRNMADGQQQAIALPGTIQDWCNGIVQAIT
ncbi:MAG: His/Gly/Thr/Pro-type tRNA ligase C-terminal domain-containing protein, partial [Deltaproteobacteria bacterium]